MRTNLILWHLTVQLMSVEELLPTVPFRVKNCDRLLPFTDTYCCFARKLGLIKNNPLLRRESCEFRSVMDPHS